MEHIDGLVAEVTPLLKAVGAVDSGALVSVGVKLAARVNALKDLSGAQKRDLVVVVLIRALGILKAEELSKAAGECSQVESIEARYSKLESVVREAVPAAIEAAIDAARGKLNLKKMKPSVLLRYCSCFASQAVAVLSSAGVISAEDAKKADLIVRKVENVSLQVAEKADGLVGEPAAEPAPAPAESAPAPVEPAVEEKA